MQAAYSRRLGRLWSRPRESLLDAEGDLRTAVAFHVYLWALAAAVANDAELAVGGPGGRDEGVERLAKLLLAAIVPLALSNFSGHSTCDDLLRGGKYSAEMDGVALLDQPVHVLHEFVGFRSCV